MAIKTVAAGGGNFNVGATWVGGVAPVSGDGIIANASSGNLTVTTNTVSLLSADFTGYTRTLALSSFSFLFNVAGGDTLILDPAMTITGTTGAFQCAQATTITSNGKTFPLRITGNSIVTLVGTATLSVLSQAVGTITGADAIVVDNAPGGLLQLTMAPGYKLIYRPTGTLAINANPVGIGYFVIDTSGLITLGSSAALIPSSSGAYNNTLEFTKTATWSGGGTIGGRPNFFLNANSAGFNGATFSLVMTANNPLNDLTIVAPSNSSINLLYPIKIISNQILFRSASSTFGTRGTINVWGSGGFSASNVNIASEKSNTLTYAVASVKLTSDATYIMTSLDASGLMPNTSSGGSPSYCIISSITASVPTTVTITNGAYSYTQINDIVNNGTLQYALVENGNVLTGTTTGFTSTTGGTSSGGGESSFTFVS